MKKDDVVSAMAKAAGITKKEAGVALDAFIEQIGSALKAGDKVVLSGFGTFEARVHPARDCKVPSTGETIHVGAKTVPAFKPGKGLKEAIQ
jgi:DNA-binding protein HU-beta